MSLVNFEKLLNKYGLQPIEIFEPIFLQYQRILKVEKGDELAVLFRAFYKHL